MVCAYLYQNIYAYITYKYITHILTHILCINMRTIRIFDHVYSSSHIFTEGFGLEHKRPLCCHVTLSVSPCCCTQYESKHAMYMQVLVPAPAYRTLITTGMQGQRGHSPEPPDRSPAPTPPSAPAWCTEPPTARTPPLRRRPLWYVGSLWVQGGEYSE